ncbi:hypothetical protein PYW08_001338 [Mythimna loreyi]|uniref:Uncharacterized protein n=1 Tax=Mythimna loreyi TaxID=667449 RepID=A0ACC2R2T5_9NEOP|nr:hypothetical protein PYW08_001338 [Mythimna loreyi]
MRSVRLALALRPRRALSASARARHRAACSVVARAPPGRDMNVFTQTPRDEPRATHYIEIVEPDPAACEPAPAHYRLLSENLLAYAPGDSLKGSLMRYDLSATMTPPRSRILELLRPEDPGRDALEAIVRPVPRRGLTRPLDEDTKRFLQRALQSPNTIYSGSATSQTHHRPPEPSESDNDPESTSAADETSYKSKGSALERSLADELREAEEAELGGARRSLLLGGGRGGRGGDAVERERLGRLALAVEEDEDEALGATARRLDALLATSRDLHAELADIQADLQASSVRARLCTAAARELGAEARALRYLDDVVALLRGDVAAAARARAWPFALGARQPGRNYVI